MKKAVYWEQGPKGTILCRLCPHYCVIQPDAAGICRVRKNINGELISLNYSQVTSLALDPIEKKPLYHFYPGSQILSVGTKGCNLFCGFCQNWQISQADAKTYDITPQTLCDIVGEYSEKGKSIGVSYTYSEPSVWFEFVIESSRLINEKGFKNVMITNGHINEEPLNELLPYIDAMNVDIKSFSSGFYKKICKGQMEPVLQTLNIAKEAGCHVEVTNLIIPDLNDSEEETEELSKWIAKELDDTVPLHFSRYYPAYKFNRPPTPIATLKKASNIARNYLKYVYIGNIPGVEGSDTICYKCGNKVIKRAAFGVIDVDLEDSKCNHCNAPIHVLL